MKNKTKKIELNENVAKVADAVACSFTGFGLVKIVILILLVVILSFLTKNIITK